MPRTIVKSAARAVEVLQLFSEERRPMRLNEIVNHLQYPQSSATTLLKSLVATGYLNYNRAARNYMPTAKVFSLGSWLPRFPFGHGRYRELVETLQKRTDETAALSVQNDLYIQYFIVRAPEHEFKLPPAEGSLEILTQTTSGMAMLSELTDPDVEKLCRHINYYELSAEGRLDINDDPKRREARPRSWLLLR